MSKRASGLDGFFDKRPKLRKVDTRFIKWNVRSLQRADSLTTAGKHLSKFNLDPVGVQ
jgi:hypothetical protein